MSRYKGGARAKEIEKDFIKHLEFECKTKKSKG
jgi:hypothetical protein